MAHQSPIRHRLQNTDAATIPFADPDNPDNNAPVVETFGSPESEYAAIRKGAALIDCPHRAALVITGTDRLEFLNRMLTQELKHDGQLLPHFRNANAFWLNRKGRIDADLRLANLPPCPDLPGLLAAADTAAGVSLADLDIIAAPHTAATLAEFVFTEDITITDATDTTHRFQLHGPATARLVADNAENHPDLPNAPAVNDLRPQQSTVARIAGRTVAIDREDTAGEIGLHITANLADAEAVFDALAQHARDDFGHHNDPTTDTYKLRHAGWAALNIARIEAGTPLFRIDFSTTNLPAETGLLDQRVSFTKGCYLGQEVVARMHSLGKPKQKLALIKIDRRDQPDDHADAPPIPPVGADIFPAPETADQQTPTPRNAKPIGAVTSATASPMLGGAPVALAQIKTDHAAPGTKLLVETDNAGPQPATVHDAPSFWSRA